MASTLARVALGTIAVLELSAAIARSNRRRQLFNEALARSAATGRPLVVIGDPDAGAWTGTLAKDYGCGSVCLDLTGCPGCPIAFAADITKGPITAVPTNSAVVYVSCVLEYVGDPCVAWSEIMRMAGSPENVFNVDVQPSTLTAALYPGAQNVIWRQDGSGTLYTSRVTPARKLLYGATIAGLVAASVL